MAFLGKNKDSKKSHLLNKIARLREDVNPKLDLTNPADMEIINELDAYTSDVIDATEETLPDVTASLNEFDQLTRKLYLGEGEGE